MVTFAFLFCSILLLLVKANGAASKRPRAIVHIGPHKTGTTHVQSVLGSDVITQGLAKENTYYINRDVYVIPFIRTKLLHLEWAEETINTTEANAMLQAQLTQALQLKRTIIISAETFSFVNIEGIMYLKEMLAGFDVTIVGVYREWISRLISSHNEINESVESGFVPFSRFIMTLDDNYYNKANPVRLFNQWMEVFGRENVVIIDYYGSQAASQTLEYILICKVANIMCETPEIINFSANKHQNVATNLLPPQVYSIFADYVKSQPGDCLLCTGKEFFQGFMRKNLRNNQELLDKLPITNISLNIIVDKSHYIDKQMRKQFESNILYSNKEINYDISAHIQPSIELNTEKFLTDRYWLNWMHEHYNNLKKSNSLCHCSK